MAFTMRAVKVPPNSASLEEARHRVFDFFKQACRSIPTIVEIYNLDDVVTASQLRSTIAKEIRKNQNVTNPKERDTNRNPPLVQPVNQCNCASAGMHGSTPANEQRGVACGGLRECRPTTNLPTRLGCTAASVKCISMLVVAKAASVAG